jgi:hypothetical protein
VIVPLAGNGEIYSLSPEEHKTVGRALWWRRSEGASRWWWAWGSPCRLPAN